MEIIPIEIRLYHSSDEKIWDDFIYASVNGSLVSTRNFLSYHPAERFKDYSLLFYKKQNLIAVLPACILEKDGKKILYSHRGATFGGLIFHPEYYNVTYIESVLDIFEKHLQEKNFSEIYLRQVPSVFSGASSGTLDYLLKNRQFQRYEELSFIIDMQKMPDQVFDGMRWNIQQQVKQGQDYGLHVKELSNDQIGIFRSLLEENLKKHNATPVHSTSELLDLKKRFPKEIEFWGCFQESNLIGAAMTWQYGSRVFHEQNMCTDYKFQNLRATNVINHFLIQLCKDRGIPYFSFGISTENNGNELNFNLARFKEGFGSEGYINNIFYKQL